MDGYLLDTCILSYWFDTHVPQHNSVTAGVEALPRESPLRISVITWGEIEYGHRKAFGASPLAQRRFRSFVTERVPSVIEVRRGTAAYYGEIRARLFDTYAPGKQRKGLRPEQLVDPITSKTLGIQENDLWMAAQAAEHNLVFVTGDKMDHLKAVADDVRFEDWTKPRED